MRRYRPLSLLVVLVVALLVGMSPVGSTAPAAGPRIEAAEAPRATTAKAGQRTKFGATVQPRSGQGYRDALRAADRRYGKLKVIRYFDPNQPNTWKQIREATGRRHLVISFKMDPQAVLNGDHDAMMRRWFKHAPTKRMTWWSFAPEPEDRIESGEYTAAQYRAAWARLSTLADAAHNRRLKATVALMCYTLNKDSGRNWRDYYAGNQHIDVFGWDCYNWAGSRGYYAAPYTSFRKAVRLAERLGKEWGIAETGSVLVGGDQGARRAEWLRKVRRFAIRNRAEFATYFDVASPNADYRLHDEPSRKAWRKAVSPAR